MIALCRLEPGTPGPKAGTLEVISGATRASCRGDGYNQFPEDGAMARGIACSFQCDREAARDREGGLMGGGRAQASHDLIAAVADIVVPRGEA